MSDIPTQHQATEIVVVGAKVVTGGGVSGWLLTVEPFLAVIVGLLTAAVLIQTLWRNWGK